MLKGNWKREMALVESKLKSPTSLDFNEFFDEYYTRTLIDTVGSNGQDIGAPPTPMYETGFLRDTLYVDKYGVDVTEYSTGIYDGGKIGLETRYDVIWDYVDNEAELIAKAFVDYIEKAQNIP